MSLSSTRRLFLMSFDLLLVHHLLDHHLEATMIINRHRQHRAAHHRALRHRIELVLEKMMMTMIEQHQINEAHKQMLIEHQSSTGHYCVTLFWLSCWPSWSGSCCPCLDEPLTFYPITNTRVVEQPTNQPL